MGRGVWRGWITYTHSDTGQLTWVFCSHCRSTGMLSTTPLTPPSADQAHSFEILLLSVTETDHLFRKYDIRTNYNPSWLLKWDRMSDVGLSDKAIFSLLSFLLYYERSLFGQMKWYENAYVSEFLEMLHKIDEPSTKGKLSWSCITSTQKRMEVHGDYVS